MINYSNHSQIIYYKCWGEDLTMINFGVTPLKIYQVNLNERMGGIGS